MSRYISASLNYLLASPLLATLRDKIESGVKAIFSCQSTEFADYSKQCQLQHCPDTANAGGVLAKETINAMASIQCTPDAKFDQITKKLLDDKGQATKYPTDVPDELLGAHGTFPGSPRAYQVWWISSDIDSFNDKWYILPYENRVSVGSPPKRVWLKNCRA